MQQAIESNEIIYGRKVYFFDTAEGVYWTCNPEDPARRYGPYNRESDARDNARIHLGD